MVLKPLFFLESVVFQIPKCERIQREVLLVGAGSCEQGTEQPQSSPESPERPRAYLEETLDISTSLHHSPRGMEDRNYYLYLIWKEH